MVHKIENIVSIRNLITISWET